jgi:hypothetical protein
MSSEVKSLREQSVRFRALSRWVTDAQTLAAIEGHCDDLDRRAAGLECGASIAAKSDEPDDNAVSANLQADGAISSAA